MKYFIVVFEFQNGKGQASFITEEIYLNKKEILGMLKESNPKAKSQIIITNIIELSEQEFNQWSK